MRRGESSSAMSRAKCSGHRGNVDRNDYPARYCGYSQNFGIGRAVGDLSHSFAEINKWLTKPHAANDIRINPRTAFPVLQGMPESLVDSR